MLFDRLTLKERLTTPAAVLALGLVLGAALLACPASWMVGVKGHLATALQPGQTAARWLRQQERQVATLAQNHFDTVAQLAEVERENARLKQENRRLVAELASLENGQRATMAATYEEDADQRLLRAHGVRARVLGHAARSFLAEHDLLDVGSQAQIRAEALVVEIPNLIDEGANAKLQTEQLAVSQGRVWGKIVEVGPQTSTVRRVTERGYRDIVRLATPGAGPHDLRWGPQGMLEGTGDRLARIRLIEVTEPVAVGDLVYTAATKGILPEPLLYGRVVSVKRPAGAAHWEIEMQPAVGAEEPDSVVVLRAELNADRGKSGD